MLKSRSLLFLFPAALVLIVLAVFSSLRNRPVSEVARDTVFPELAGAINAVAQIRVQGGGQSISLEKDGDIWRIREADDYPADFGRIRQTAISVAELRVIAPKTRRPDQYAALGVDDPAAAGSAARLLTLLDAGGGTLAQLIVGKRRLSSSPGDGSGLYIRLPDQDQALLVDGRLDAGLETADWIKRDLFSIDSDRIGEITIVHGGGDRINLMRDPGQEDLILTTIPEGKQAQSQYVINRMQDILENVQIDDVRAAERFTVTADNTVTEVKTRDGLSVTITSLEQAEDKFTRFAFLYEPAPSAPDAADAEDAGTVPADAEADAQEETMDVAAQAAQLAELTAGWWFRIPDYKFRSFNRLLDDLVEDIEAQQTDGD